MTSAGEKSECSVVPNADAWEMSFVPPEWRARVSGSLINPDTLLATDYLNHFNEVIMLIGMVADMPEILVDAQAWVPKSYPTHFRGSGLDYGELAAEAYDHVPPAFKTPFEVTVQQLNSAIAITLKRLAQTAEAGDIAEMKRIGDSAVHVLTTLIGVASGIIAGGKSTLVQEEIDSLL